jgi:hypothetical protein
MVEAATARSHRYAIPNTATAEGATRFMARPVCWLLFGATGCAGRLCGCSEFRDLVVERMMPRWRFTCEDRLMLLSDRPRLRPAVKAIGEKRRGRLDDGGCLGRPNAY